MCTRWLSLHVSVDALCRININIKTTVIKRKWRRPNDEIFFKTKQNPKFLRMLHILKLILPSLPILGKAFQRGSINVFQTIQNLVKNKPNLKRYFERKNDLLQLLMAVIDSSLENYNFVQLTLYKLLCN